MKCILFILIFAAIFWSCCEKDVYLPPDPVDELVGIYIANQFNGIKDYKIKVIKLSADTIKLKPYIGSEMFTNTAVYKKTVDNKKIFLAHGAYDLIFTLDDPVKINYYMMPEYKGYKIE